MFQIEDADDLEQSLERKDSLFSSEPLYQIYHCGAVLRDVVENDMDSVEG